MVDITRIEIGLECLGITGDLLDAINKALSDYDVMGGVVIVKKITV